MTYMTITAEQARRLERERNVYIDIETASYTTGERDDEYGWLPVPGDWLEETR